jgi:hypothetical protein
MPKSPKQLASFSVLALGLALVAGFAPSQMLMPARAFNIPGLAEEESFKNATMVDGKKFLEQLRKNLSQYNDYTFDSALYMYKPAAERVGGGNICWKKLNLIKITVKTKGIKDGSVVARTPEGKIKAWGGPNLRFLKMNLQEDSRILRAPNGYNAIKSDLGNLLTTLSQSVAQGSKSKVTSQPIQVGRMQQNLYVLQIFQPGTDTDVMTEQIFVNPATNIPVEWDLFRNGTRYSVAIFENFKPNIGLDDNQFQI